MLENRARRGPDAAQHTLDDRAFAEFRDLLNRMSGIVLKENKRALVESRIQRRLRALGLESYEDYLDALQKDDTGQELVLLIDAISTNVTHFFRERDHFDFLKDFVERCAAEGRDRLRFWSAACSSGEEPYSMAMMLREADPAGRLDLKILATDIGTHVLDRAMNGVYRTDDVEKVPAELREKYLTRVVRDGVELHAVRQELKDLIMFRRLNLSRFPYPIRGVFDVIFCRNVMFYFDRSLRERMIREFQGLVRDGGYLLIGHSETLIGIESGFQCSRAAVYRR